MNSGVFGLTAAQLARAYRTGQLSPVEAVDLLARRIEEIDPSLGAFAALRLDEAREEARARTDELARGTDLGPLHGIPVAVKELFDVADLPTTYGSVVFAGRVPATDARAVVRLRAAGAVIVGSTRSHEFGWGLTSQHSTLGNVGNPWDPSRVPGGSSGGSAAAVAAGLVPIAIGTDTGGSVRIPAAFCGVVGLKPTFGRVSRRGLVPLAPSLDHVGVLSRDEGDALTALRAMAGFDASDPWSVDLGPGDDCPRGPTWRLLHTAEDQMAGLGEDQRSVLLRVIDALEDAGMRLSPRAADPDVLATFVPIQLAEAHDVHTQVLQTYPANLAAYGPDVRARLELAERVTLSDYLRATERRRELVRRWESDLASVDAVLTPLVGTGAPPVANPDMVDHQGRTVSLREVVLPHTVAQDLTGLPSLALPVGTDRDGQPLGVQLTVARGQEGLLVRLARTVSEHAAAAGLVRPAVAPVRG